MNRKVFSASIFISLLTGNLIFSQQKVLPGAVADPYFWIKSTNTGANYYWENLTGREAKISAKPHRGAVFNYNPAIVFDAAHDSLILPLGTESKRRQTLFMVYKVKDSLKEQFLWTLSDPKKTLSTATNKRLADLKKYSYQSYREKNTPQKANIHFFQQNITDSVAKPSALTIGLKPKFINLPPEEFQGNISEILVYNRVLSGIETQKVASYLGIKYGISLVQFDTKNYLNSLGETIWDMDKHKGFTASITAMGRDDASGLLQTKSSNMLDEGLVTMELKSKSNTIPNKYFVFWSDNGKNLLVKKQEQGEPLGIARQWQLDFVNPTDISLNWEFNPSFIKGDLPNDTYYWLEVDYSGKGSYQENNSQYIRLGKTSDREKLVLNDFDWNRQKSGKIHFTLKVAPAMFSKVWITEATCGVTGSGELRYTIEGGEAPFTITVKKEGSDTVLKKWSQTSKSSTGLKLSSGTYQYMVRDKKGNLYTQTVFVADKEGTSPNLKSDYLLTDAKALILDASSGLAEGNYEYQWYYEGDFMDNNPKIWVDRPGNYELRLLNGQGCHTTTKITVASDGKETSPSNAVILYPNPTTDGHFTVAMQFAEKTDATLTIYSPTGALVKQKQFSRIATAIYEETITGSSGMYLVQVASDFGTKTFKVIVK